LNNRDIDNLLNLDNLRNSYDFLNNFLYDLRHFYNLFNDSRNDNNFLYDFLYFNHLRDLDKFLYDLFNNSGYSFHSLDNFLNRNNSILNDSDNLWLSNKMINNLFDFFHSVLVKNLWLFDLNLLMNDFLNNLNNWLFNNLSLNFYDFMNQRHLNNFLNDLFYCSVFNNWLLDYFLDFFDSISINGFLDNDFDLYWLFNDIMNLDNLLNDLGNFNNLLNSLNNWDNLLYYSVNWLISNFNMVSNIRSWNILNSLDDLLNNLLNLNNFWHFNPHLNNLLNDLVDWY